VIPKSTSRSLSRISVRRLGSVGPLIVVLAVFVLFVPGPTWATDTEILTMERRMFELVNSERKARKLPMLEFDEELAVVARAHSKDMADNGFFDHESPTTGKSADRVYAAGIAASATAENIAMNSSVADAHARLMASPGHRKNILSREYDRIGIGIVRKMTTLYVTQNFRKAIRTVDPEALKSKIFKAFNARRQKARLSPLKAHPVLMRMAQQVADRQNREQGLLAHLPGQHIRSIAFPYRQFWSFVYLDSNAQKTVSIRELGRDKINSVGIGVCVNRTRERGLGMLWIVILLAEVTKPR